MDLIFIFNGVIDIAFMIILIENNIFLCIILTIRSLIGLMIFLSLYIKKQSVKNGQERLEKWRFVQEDFYFAKKYTINEHNSNTYIYTFGITIGNYPLCIP
ncbi:hypothetical protein OM999_03585 [Mycoplasmopsis cynos]|nr:hypothetical protein OM999_03585 [Mycoplasmopsis cynos]